MTGDNPSATVREVRAAAVLLAAVVLLSIVVGAIWGMLAPTRSYLVIEPDRPVPFTGENLHHFDALALFVCAGAATGLLSAVGAWRMRRMRGPIQVVGLVLGSGIGAVVMTWFGEIVAERRNPFPDELRVGEIVTEAPTVETWVALIVQPLTAALVMVFLAALSAGADLGTGFVSAFDDSRPLPPEFRSPTARSPHPAPVATMVHVRSDAMLAPQHGGPGAGSPSEVGRMSGAAG